MTQASLLDWQRPIAAPSASEQDKQAARVGGRIDQAIIRWCRLNAGRELPLSEFTADIVSLVECAPDSPRRRLQALVQAGYVRAECVDRSRSMWRVT
jgi:hypothetical protein